MNSLEKILLDAAVDNKAEAKVSDLIAESMHQNLYEKGIWENYRYTQGLMSPRERADVEVKKCWEDHWNYWQWFYDRIDWLEDEYYYARWEQENYYPDPTPEDDIEEYLYEVYDKPKYESELSAAVAAYEAEREAVLSLHDKAKRPNRYDQKQKAKAKRRAILLNKKFEEDDKWVARGTKLSEVYYKKANHINKSKLARKYPDLQGKGSSYKKTYLSRKAKRREEANDDERNS